MPALPLLLPLLPLPSPFPLQTSRYFAFGNHKECNLPEHLVLAHHGSTASRKSAGEVVGADNKMNNTLIADRCTSNRVAEAEVEAETKTTAAEEKNMAKESILCTA